MKVFGNCTSNFIVSNLRSLKRLFLIKMMKHDFNMLLTRPPIKKIDNVEISRQFQGNSRRVVQNAWNPDQTSTFHHTMIQENASTVSTNITVIKYAVIFRNSLISPFLFSTKSCWKFNPQNIKPYITNTTSVVTQHLMFFNIYDPIYIIYIIYNLCICTCEIRTNCICLPR